MSAQLPAFPLRMPPELRGWLEVAARSNGRSLNSELVQRLKEVMYAATAEKEAVRE